jgi:hypothetical protein
MGSRKSQVGCPLAQCVTGSFEADTIQFDSVIESGLEHEGADQVIGDQVHVQLTADHLGTKTSQHVHAHRGLDVSKEQLDQPPAAIQIGE